MREWLRENLREMEAQWESMKRGASPGLGWLLPAGMLVGKAISKIAGNKAKKKQGEAINKAEENKAAAAQENRGARLGLLQSMLKGVQSGISGGGYSPASGDGYTGGTAGRPDYTLDPEALGRMSKAPAYTAGPDAAAGADWSLVGDLAGMGADAAEAAMVGRESNKFDELLAKMSGGARRGAGQTPCINGRSTLDGGPC